MVRPFVFDAGSVSANLTFILASVGVRTAEAARPPPSPEAQLACGRSLVRTLGPKAFRRPLDADELGRFDALFDAGRTSANDFYDGAHMVIEAFLQSASFRYQVEVGEPVAGRAGFYRLDGYAVASRLSYLVWGTLPDDTLFAEAAAGRLDTEEQIATQAERLFGDPRARETVAKFTEQWLYLDRLPTLTRDLRIYPQFTNDERTAMSEETRRFLDEVIWDDHGSLADVLLADHTWMNEPLAALYGVSLPAAGWQRVTLPPERVGLLTQPSILAVTSKPHESSPIHRGVFVLKELLCDDLERPPGLMVMGPEPDPTKTTRERWAQITAEPACGTCHRRINPVGFAFENFDGVGAYRTSENGFTIDATGGIPNLNVADGTLTGVRPIAQTLARSPEVESCFARQWLRFGLGRRDFQAEDLGSIEAMRAQLSAGGIREMLVRLTRTEAFRHRIVPQGGL